MADRVNSVNMNNTLLSENTFIVKEEECQQDSFIDVKVYISETAFSIEDAKLQSSMWNGSIEQHEESTNLNIKTELALREVTENNVKIEGGFSADDIQIVFNNGLLYCEHCEAYYEDYCIECGMLMNILNKYVLNSADNGVQGDIPNDILEIQDCLGQIGIYTIRIVPAGVKFGPFTGLIATECPWEMKGEKFVLDKYKSKYLNWMQYINPTRNFSEGNLQLFQCENEVYYQTTRQIRSGEELLVYFGDEYGDTVNKIVRADVIKHIVEDIYACTFCCLGFSSKSHLAKHKTICVEDAARKFSIEELTQCPFCKIHLDPKEYSEHHMAFCCERNARKCILPTSPAKQARTTLNGHRRSLRPMYKCEQCKYKTKNQGDFKKHTKQHYDIKMYKCGNCNKLFKTRKILRLHVENTHVYVGETDDQEHSTTDYRNTHVKVGQSSSRGQKKIFNCSFCVVSQFKCKQSLRSHIKAKHLLEFDYTCDKCEFRTNHKNYLQYHEKSKHLNKFDYKCHLCEFSTNYKRYLKSHVKTKHLKEFDYKCDSCKFRTNHKQHLEYHTKSKHLNEFDYKCDSCKFRTNKKHHLEYHIKSKHLKDLNYKCDSCTFITNNKRYIGYHIKTKHLKEFDYKCDSCEFRTNTKQHLEYHIKTKHLKEFCYKCDLCKFRTNNKQHLEYHIKNKHSKEFDYKCLM